MTGRKAVPLVHRLSWGEGQVGEGERHLQQTDPTSIPEGSGASLQPPNHKPGISWTMASSQCSLSPSGRQGLGKDGACTHCNKAVSPVHGWWWGRWGELHCSEQNRSLSGACVSCLLVPEREPKKSRSLPYLAV